MAVCSESSLSMSCWEVGVLTAVFFLSCLKSCLDRCVLIVWHPLTWITVKSYEPERFTFSGQTPQLHSTPRIRSLWSTLLLLFFFFFLRAGSQIAGEQPLTPTVLLVYVELISLTNIVPLFHFSRSAFAKLFLRRFGSLKTTVWRSREDFAQSRHRKKCF